MRAAVGGGGWPRGPGGRGRDNRAGGSRAFRGAGGYGAGRGLSLGSLVLGGALGAGVGAGLAIWYLEQRKSAAPVVDVVARRDGNASAADPLDHPALKHGMPVGSVLRPFTNFVSFFDTRTRNPQWVIERISEETSRGDGDRKFSQFKEDDKIPDKFRNKLDDFRGSGYDRGHLAPASAHKLSQATMDETFTLSNISPQVGDGFNRDYWARFESYVKSLSKDHDEVHVVTGPLFLPQPKLARGLGAGERETASEWEMRYDLLGRAPELTAVPTHFFKIVLTTRAKAGGRKEHSIGSFVMPNAYIPPDSPLTRFIVPLDSLERAVGTTFFPKLVRSGGNEGYDFDRAALKWQKNGEREMKMLESSKDDDGAGVVVRDDYSEERKSKGIARVRNMAHLCDSAGCKLPEPGFWKKKGGSSSNYGRRRN